MHYPESFQLLTAEAQRMLPSVSLAKQALPDCPDIALWLIDPTSITGPITTDQYRDIWLHPCYWGFCWASGQVLASYILSHPDQFEGKSVIDFGAGSGIVAIAAAKVGAKVAIACDIDPLTRYACQLNAELNRVKIAWEQDIHNIPSCDWLVAADVFYDSANLTWLDQFGKWGKSILVADSRIRHWPAQQYHYLETQRSNTVPDMGEALEFGNVKLYRYDHK